MKLLLLLYHASFCYFFLLDCDGKGNEKISETSKYLMENSLVIKNILLFLQERHYFFHEFQFNLLSLYSKSKTYG